MQRQHSSQATSTLGNTPNLNIGFLHQKENPTPLPACQHWNHHNAYPLDLAITDALVNYKQVMRSEFVMWPS